MHTITIVVEGHESLAEGATIESAEEWGRRNARNLSVAVTRGNGTNQPILSARRTTETVLVFGGEG